MGWFGRWGLLAAVLGAAVLGAAIGGCDGTDGPADGAVDAGMDARVERDECAASTIAAADTVGCNGPLIGPNPPIDRPDAPCDGDGDCSGGGRCEPDTLGRPRCVYRCPAAPTYVSTGGCPIGSRCFTQGREGGRCFRDCLTDVDCGLFARCDVEGSCVNLDLDAGPRPDAADGGPEGGLVPDAGRDGG